MSFEEEPQENSFHALKQEARESDRSEGVDVVIARLPSFGDEDQ